MGEPLLTSACHAKDALLAVHMDQHNGERTGQQELERLFGHTHFLKLMLVAMPVP